MANQTKKRKSSKKNQAGFTLIELLAVITIMGILMMVAIPAVSRTIENSRRDTFKNTAQAYANALQHEISSDAVQCNIKAKDTDPDNYQYISAVAAGDTIGYAYYFNSGNTTGTDLMEQGGKSSWGNANVAGNVTVVKKTSTTGGVSTTSYVYYVAMTDGGGRGIDQMTKVEDLTRSSVKTSGAAAPNTMRDLKPAGVTKVYSCKLSG